MEKLTELQINPFLPHKLQSVHYFQGEALLREVTYHNVSCYIYGSTQAKILLHNIDCLTKTIQHEGREFCPLIELAKIAGLSGDFRIEHEMLISSEGDVFYLSGSISWVLRRHGERFTVSNQYQLFQKLAEWHIDFLGLIEKGLAIEKDNTK